MTTKSPLPLARSILTRADLLRSMATGREELVAAVAAQLGLELRVEEHHEKIVEPFPPSDRESISSDERLDNTAYPSGIVDIALWLTFAYEQRIDLSLKKEDVNGSHLDWKWSNPPRDQPHHKPLQSWRTLSPRLRAILEPVQQSHRIDIDKLVRAIASRDLVHRLPRVARRRWNGELFVVSDRSVHLAPYFEDQDLVAKNLVESMSNRSVTRLFGDSPNQLYQLANDEEFCFRQPSVGSRVLVLGDLGALSSNKNAWRSWYQWGRALAQRDCELLALVPCSERRLPRAIVNLYTTLSWQGNSVAEIREDGYRLELVEKILTLAAPTDRLEPGLLRDLRLLLPEASNGSLESDVWMSPWVSSNHTVAATVDRDFAKHQLRPNFEALPLELRRKALNTIRSWRKQLEDSPEIWFVELLNLSDSSRELLPDSDLQDARAFIRLVDVELDSTGTTIGLEEFAQRFTRRASDGFAMKDAEVGSILRKRRAQLNPDMEIHPSTDPLEIPPTSDFERFEISIDEQSITFDLASVKQPTDPPDSNSTIIHTSNSVLKLVVTKQWTEFEFWKSGVKPDFVSAFGRDEFGAWFEFQVPRRNGDGVVTQRMRWIRPGSLMMGSPSSEPERYDDEELQQVTLTRGFWLADTACTQALWEAVTGTKPSHFQVESRPVEQVNYVDVLKFCTALEHQTPGLLPQLPTEAQWEYACRAGTQTPFSFGESISTDQANFDGNSPYGNTPKGIYRQETVSVKDLPANPWGLYQMHGNVWEWCSDWYAERLTGSQTDPTGPMEGTVRVVRGGSWINDARNVRSACRNGYDPGFRSLYLGFRLLSSATAEPSEMAKVPVAEQGSKPDRIGGAAENCREYRVRVDALQPMQLEIDRATKVRVVSNLESVELQRWAKPQWAVEYGRDVYGVYGDFEVLSAKDGSAVQQRLRWIPPGSFQMGSPEDEPGRSEDEMLHPVTISHGFWMFDAPCSQKLWSAIMEESPSYFADPDRPVEQVGWEQVKNFAQRLGERLKHLTFTLPTEAQWEYACRAGTSTAIYTGAMEILGDANAPALDSIAWYGGNSGHQYDLDKRRDVSSFEWLSNKQYKFTHAGTRKMKQKAPNAWGLYDMLGNVWEWCEDWYGEYVGAPAIDPTGPESGSDRVIRGGGWIASARGVRSACRGRYDPGNRVSDLGFRLLSSVGPVQAAERVSDSRRVPRDEAEENQRTK